MYNYSETLKEDIENWIEENKDSIGEFEDFEDLEECIHNALWVEDGVTGNGSDAGYPLPYDELKVAVTDNSELCKDALNDFGTPAEQIAEHFLNGDWRYFDATIRCYLLGEVLNKVLGEHEEEYERLFIKAQ